MYIAGEMHPDPEGVYPLSSSPLLQTLPGTTSPPAAHHHPQHTEPDHAAEHEEHAHGIKWTELIRIAFVALAAAAVWFRLWEPFQRVSVIGIAATLLKRVQLTISGYVGPCDVPNVVVITNSCGTEWLGNIDRFEQYRTLVEWQSAAEMPAKC
jgi:hypothetical protein